MANAVTFDTHALIKELKGSGFKEEQAEALTNAFKKVQETSIENLATKDDIKDLTHEIKELELKINGQILLLKWMMGVIIAGVISLVFKAFFIP